MSFMYVPSCGQCSHVWPELTVGLRHRICLCRDCGWSTAIRQWFHFDFDSCSTCGAASDALSVFEEVEGKVEDCPACNARSLTFGCCGQGFLIDEPPLLFLGDRVEAKLGSWAIRIPDLRAIPIENLMGGCVPMDGAISSLIVVKVSAPNEGQRGYYFEFAR